MGIPGRLFCPFGMLPSDLVLLCFISLWGRGWTCRSGLLCEELAQQDVANVCIQVAVLKLFTGDAISFVYEFFYVPGVMFGLRIPVPGFPHTPRQSRPTSLVRRRDPIATRLGREAACILLSV